MKWEERPVWVQFVIAVLALALWVWAILEGTQLLINVSFAVAGAVVLLIVSNRSRRWGAVTGVLVYILLMAFAYRGDARCFALARQGDLCGLASAGASVLGWALIPFGALIGGGIGWIVGKVKERRQRKK